MSESSTKISAVQGLSSPKKDGHIRSHSLVPTILSSVLMAVGGMGDALLYVYLPVQGQALGMSLVTIGILLSINKFSRIFTNRWVAWFSREWGVRKILMAGTVLSGLTTLMYAFNPDIWLWILSRMIWGFSYSSFRFCTIQYAGTSGKTGSALGIGRSIQEMGPILAYWIGPVLINEVGATPVFVLWSVAITILLPLFIWLPDVKSPEQKIKALAFKKPGYIDYWIFVTSFAVEGLLVVGVSKLIDIKINSAGDLMVIAALLISSRRFMNVLISPLSGWMSDSFSFKKTFRISCFMIIAGVALIAAGFSITGVLIAYAGSAINMTLIPAIAIDYSPDDQNFEILTRMSTARDIGSATGALLALNIFALLNTTLPFVVVSVALVFIWHKMPTLNYDQ
ncbi:MAG: MFS transporter [Balneolaceae bacterium]|nr:MFS transporter [Balneolaceae bacterium]